MEKQYGDVGHETNPRVFFRGRLSTQDILAESKRPFVMWEEKKESQHLFMDLIDEPGSCSESCEPFK